MAHQLLPSFKPLFLKVSKTLMEKPKLIALKTQLGYL